MGICKALLNLIRDCESGTSLFFSYLSTVVCETPICSARPLRVILRICLLRLDALSQAHSFTKKLIVYKLTIYLPICNLIFIIMGFVLVEDC